MPDCTERCFTNISQFSVRKPRGESINDSLAKQAKQTGDYGFISVSQMSLLKLNFRTGQLSLHVTKDWGNHAHCMFIPKGKKGRGEPSSPSYSSQIHQPGKSLCLPRNGVS